MGGGFRGAKTTVVDQRALHGQPQGEPCTVSRSAWEGVEGEGGEGGLGGLGVYRHLTQGEPSTQGLRSVVSGSRVRVWRGKKTTVVAR